jgi:hypothetical protein
MMKDVAMVSLETPAFHLPGWTEKNHDRIVMVAGLHAKICWHNEYEAIVLISLLRLSVLNMEHMKTFPPNVRLLQLQYVR